MVDRRTTQEEDRLAGRLQEAVQIASHPQPVPVNLYDAGEAYVLVAPLPGVMPDDVSVVIEPGKLHIRAEMRAPALKDYLVHEWHYGPYERTLDLPDDCGAEARASFGNGQLALELRKGGAPAAAITIRPG